MLETHNYPQIWGTVNGSHKTLSDAHGLFSEDLRRQIQGFLERPWMSVEIIRHRWTGRMMPAEGLLGACAPRPFGVALRALNVATRRCRTLIVCRSGVRMGADERLGLNRFRLPKY